MDEEISFPLPKTRPVYFDFNRRMCVYLYFLSQYSGNQKYQVMVVCELPVCDIFHTEENLWSELVIIFICRKTAGAHSASYNPNSVKKAQIV